MSKRKNKKNKNFGSQKSQGINNSVKSNPFNSNEFFGSSGVGGSAYNTPSQQLDSYKTLNWVAACVDAIARDAGGQPWSLKTVDGKDIKLLRLNEKPDTKGIKLNKNGNLVNNKGVEIEVKRVSDDIMLPLDNGYAGETFSNIIKKIIIPHLLLEGNAFLWKVSSILDDNEKKDALVPIRPDMVEIVLDTTEMFLVHYIITFTNGARRTVLPSDMIHFKQNTVFNPHIGVGNITKMRLLAEGESSAEAFQNEFLKNKAATNLVVEDSRENIGDDDIRANRQEIIRSTGGIKNAGVPIYAHSGMKVKTVTTSQKDMQFLESKIYNRQATLSLFGVPPITLGIPDNANKAIAQTMQLGYLKNTINNLLNELSQTITMQLVRPADKSIMFQFELYDTGDIDNIKTAFSMGIISPNEARIKLGSLRVEEDYMDEYYGTLSQTPYKFLAEEVEATETPVKPVSKDIEAKVNLYKVSTDAIYAKYSKSLGATTCTKKRVYTSAIVHAIKNHNTMYGTDIITEISNPSISKVIQATEALILVNDTDLKGCIEEAYKIGMSISIEKKKDIKARAPKKMLQFHKKVVKSRIPIEKVFNSKVKDSYKAIEKSVLKEFATLDKAFNDQVVNIDTLFDKNKTEKIVATAMKPLFETSIEEAAGVYDAEFGTLAANSPKITSVADKLSKTYASETLNTNHKELKKLLANSYINKDDYVTTKSKIQEYFNLYTDDKNSWKATRIARSEMSNIYDQASKISYEELGVDKCQVVGCSQIEPDTDCDSDGSRGTHLVSNIDSLVFHPSHIGSIVPVIEED